MAGGNFNDLRIDGNGRVSPSGPLPMASDEDILALFAWVIQENEDKTGAVCVAFEQEPRFTSRVEWKTRDDAVHWGKFRPGPATGVAVTVSRLGKVEPHVHWWTESLQLRNGDDSARTRSTVASSQNGTRSPGQLVDEILNALQSGGVRGLAGQGLSALGAARSGRVTELLEEALRLLRGG